MSDGETRGAPAPEEFAVPSELAGARLDRALATLAHGRSRERVKALIEAGAVRIDGRVARRPSEHVQAGERLTLDASPPAPVRPGNRSALEPVVLREDEHLVVVDKPAGMVAHPSEAVGGGTLSEWAVERYGALPVEQGEDRPGIVHRLDAETSGVMLLARTPEAARELVRQFRERAVRKLYLALVQGEPRFDSDWIETPLERDAGRVTVAAAGEGREARTFYRTLERLGPASLLEVELGTGRTHQIRVHLESIGHPVLGDKLYRGRRPHGLPPEAPLLERQALHAATIEFAHPADGAPVRVEAPLPADMARLLAWLRARAGGERRATPSGGA